MKRFRRYSASTVASPAAIHIGASCSLKKRSIVPNTLLLCSSRGECSALLPAMNALLAVNAGIPNQNSGCSSSPTIIIRRIDGIARHAHTV